MYLLVDNSDLETIKIALSSNLTEWKIVEEERGGRVLLEVIVNVLNREGKNPGDLKGLAIVLGIGRFTATRVATVTANSLAYVFKIPVVGVSSFDRKAAGDLLASAKPGEYVLPVYSAGAHIGGRQEIK